MFKISTNPHIQTSRTTQELMLDVVIALMPAALTAVMFFGIDALRVILTSVAGCLLFEYAACRLWLRKQTTTNDFSAVINLRETLDALKKEESVPDALQAEDDLAMMLLNEGDKARRVYTERVIKIDNDLASAKRNLNPYDALSAALETMKSNCGHDWV